MSSFAPTNWEYKHVSNSGYLANVPPLCFLQVLPLNVDRVRAQVLHLSRSTCRQAAEQMSIQID